jgi:hypothetical protein
MSNGFVAGLGGALNPFDYVAASGWRKLTPDEKLAIEPELGITHQHHAIVDQTYLGAATNNRFIERVPGVQAARPDADAAQAEPARRDVPRRRGQNNFFRRAVYSTGEAGRLSRMGANWKDIDERTRRCGSTRRSR